MKFTKDVRVKFALVALCYLLWVIWIRNYWLLIGLPIIYDIYISQKVNWTFWKKREGKNNIVIEWLDALIFAVVAVSFINIFFFQNYKIPTGSMEKSLLKGDHLFVSKLSYGPRIPNTPIAFPFAQNVMPLTQKMNSFVEWLYWPYKRLAGFGDVKRNDVVVFNFPAGDTVVIQRSAESYQSILQYYAEQLTAQDLFGKRPIQGKKYYYARARQYVWANNDIVYRPVDKRDNYIKRCVAIPGDSIQIINTQVYINGKPQAPIEFLQFKYLIKTDGSRLNPKSLERAGIPAEDCAPTEYEDIFKCPMTTLNVDALKTFSNVKSVVKDIRQSGQYASYIFPHDPGIPWNEDNFGPLVIPKKGVTVQLSMENIAIYERIIDIYEENDFLVKEGKIYIDGKEATSYTFKMNYYFMMGDNRHDSADSRFWGFVPEDHVVGSPVFIWLSLDKTSGFFNSIRWERMFMGVK